MSDARMTLDNQVFSGALRYERRSVSYVPRPVQMRTIQDIAVVRKQPVRPKASLMIQSAAKQPRRRYMDVKPNHVKHHSAQSAGTVQPRQDVATGKTHKKPRRLRRLLHKQLFLYAGAILVFGLGLYAGLSGLYANKQVAVQVKTLQKTAQVKGVDTGDTGSTDETVPPSTEKPTPAAVRSYAVSPVNPRYIAIPKLKVHARVLSMGVDRKNEVKAPYGIYDAGWYNASSLPGENGAMLIDGHSGIGKTHGIFHDLTKLVAGDDITVTRGDGKTFTYKVVEMQVVDKDKVDMTRMLVSADTAKPGLTLITCAGSQVPGTFSLKQRVVVRAVAG